MNDDTEGGLLVSPALWIGGPLCWALVLFLGWLLSKVPM